MTDQDYIIAIRNNDQKAITKMYAKFRSSTLGYLRKHTSLSSDDISDIYQEAMILVVNKASSPTFLLTSALSTFIISVSDNMAKNRTRKNSRAISLDDDKSHIHNLSNDETNQHDAIEQQEQYRTLRHIISDMGEPCQSLLKAFYWEELSYEEIAKKLPNYSTADSARNNKSRCVTKLRSFYEKLTS